MSVTVFDYIKKVERAKALMPYQVDVILRENEAKILDLNRKDQLFNEGINRFGTIIGRYSQATESITNGEKKAGEPFTMYDTGDLYKRFTYLYDAKKQTVEIFSTDSKVPLLIMKYSENIFGLTPTNKEKLNNQIIKPELLKWLKSLL